MIRDEADKFTLDRAKAVLVVIDVQQRLVPSMDPAVYEGVRRSIDCAVRGAELLGVPVVATEQYPKGLGPTVPELSAACTSQVIEKLSFGCCGEPAFLDYIRGLGRTQVLVTGMEAHVCVYQTVLGLLEAGYHVHLLRDAVCSRGKTDYLAALENAASAGAVVSTTEMSLFQLLRSAAAQEFKAVSALIKQR
jgi:nicotinamidase-related amidase